MKILALVLAALVGSSAQAASSVQPEHGQPACFKREYTGSHMRRHPGQHLSSVYVMVDADKFADSDYPEVSGAGADVVGVKKGEYFSNSDSSCEFKADGSAHCAIECDGGAFDLTPKGSDVFFSVAKDYYFPLYRRGTSSETATEGDSVQLLWEDKENQTYKLEQVPVGECRRALDRAKHGEWGC